MLRQKVLLSLPAAYMPDPSSSAPLLQRGRGRKFSIRSNFGSARTPRSRKSRPCDVCRRRKTACVITDVPPCLFCRTRGLECSSSPRSARPLSDTGEDPTSASDHAISRTDSVDYSSFSLPPSPIRHRLGDVSIHPGDAQPTPLPLYDSPVPQLTVTANHVSPAHTSPGHNLPRAGVRDQTLEDVPGRTAHSMGLTAEQDNQLLDTFRSVVMSEIEEVDAAFVQVFPGDARTSAPPVHFLLLQDGFPEHTELALRKASESIEETVAPHGPALVRLYFRHVHPAYPVVSKGRFLRLYQSARESLPASLRGAMYALASSFWDSDPSLNQPCPFAQHVLATYASDVLRQELEAPNLFKLQACFLLLHMRPPDIDSVETPNLWILAAQATACAQIIGLHRDPTHWDIPEWEKALRKKLWWATYLTDCWTAVCHGNPPHISATTFNTADLTIGDMRLGEDVEEDLRDFIDPADTGFEIVVGARFIASVDLAKHLRMVLDSAGRIESGFEPSVNGSSHHTQLSNASQAMHEWLNLLPQCLSPESNASLHISFFAAQVLLFRGLIHPTTKKAKRDPNSSLRKWFPSALTQSEKFVAFIAKVTEQDFSGFWVRYTRSQLILCGNFLIHLFLAAWSQQDVEAAYELLESFRVSLQRLASTGDVNARLRLRPVMLRLESFFKQAPDLIRQASGSDSSW